MFMSTISAVDFPTEGYAIHVDMALGPHGPVNDAVLAVKHGVIVNLCSAADYASQPRGLKPMRMTGTAMLPGILDVHHHVIEPFVKALTCGEPAQMWKRIWLPLEATLTEQSAYLGAKWTFLEALRGGITTIVDHGIRTRAIAAAINRAADDTGIRLDLRPASMISRTSRPTRARPTW